MKACVACGKQLPDAAINCVFCKARQREERLDQTPVRPVRNTPSPHGQALASEPAEDEGPDARRKRSTLPERPSSKKAAEDGGRNGTAGEGTDPVMHATPGSANGAAAGGHAATAADTPADSPGAPVVGASDRGRSPDGRRATEREERSVLVRLSSWNRNERASLVVAGLAALVAELAFGGLRSAVLIVGAASLLLAGLLPLPRLARGVVALGAGVIVLGHVLPVVAALALPLLPGALLARAKNPGSRLAQLAALAGTGAVVAAYLIPRGATSPAQAILAGLASEQFTPIAAAIYVCIPIPLVVVGLLAVMPRRTVGGCVLWATLMLAWAPLGVLIDAWWRGSPLMGLAFAVVLLGASASAALGVADLSSA
jgi:hypothetical protein